MDRILYAGHDFATATDIARAVIDYAGTLAQMGRYATIDIPIVALDGAPSTATLLLGPALPIASRPIQGPAIELVDSGTVSALRDAAEHLRSPSEARWELDRRRDVRMIDELDFDKR